MRRQDDKTTYIEWALHSKVGMVLGKFLIPEICAEMKIKVDDLIQLRPLVQRLDPRHDYERIIYESYLINNDFYLTDE